MIEAMTVEDRVKLIIGSLVVESAMLNAKIEELQKALAEKPKDQPDNG
jgi:hypothetical protein